MNPSERRRAAYESLQGRKGRPARERPYLGIQFECCGAYARVYRREGESAYVGRCPRCLRVVRFRVDPSGTSHRFFRVY